MHDAINGGRHWIFEDTIPLLKDQVNSDLHPSAFKVMS
jgi:hypothetical protein